MKKKLITIAMLAALAVGSAVSLTACGGGDNSGSSAAPESSSSAPASSVAEAVSETASSEAAAPSSEATSSTSDFVPDESGVKITDKKFDISAENLAKSINYYCKTASLPEGKITTLPDGSVKMEFETDEILILASDNQVSSVMIQSDTEAYNTTAHWASTMTALLGFDNYFVDTDHVHSDNLLKYGSDVWDGIGSTLSAKGSSGSQYLVMPE